MNNAWKQRGLGSTAGTVLVLALQGTQLQGAEASMDVHSSRWTVRQEPSTSGTIAAPFSGSYGSRDRAFESELAQAYAVFATSQKPLDPEFARILVPNLWDLYAR